MITWLFLGAAILSEVAGTLSLRMSDGFTRKKWIIAIVLAYVIAFGFIMLVLNQGMAIGVAYGIWAAAGIALTAILGRILFKDPLTAKMGFGIVLIIGGVLLVELSGTH
jgi:small multidrug resistance pump